MRFTLAPLAQPKTALRFALWVAAATLACAAISVAFAFVSSWVQTAVAQSPALAQDVAPVLRRRFVLDALFVFMALVAAPLLETLLIAIGVSLAHERAWPARRTVLVSGAVWGLLHAANGLLAILPAAFVFMVLTAAYIHWRKLSVELALLAAALPHFFVNAAVAGLKATLA